MPAIAADAAPGDRDHARNEGRCHDRIDRVPAIRQYGHPSFGPLRVAHNEAVTLRLISPAPIVRSAAAAASVPPVIAKNERRLYLELIHALVAARSCLFNDILNVHN